MVTPLIRLFVFSFLTMIPLCVLGMPPKDILVIAHRLDEVITLDPAEIFEFASLEYAANTYERLVSYNAKDPTEVYGVLATHWDISTDGKTYTFYLKRNITFSSGNPLTADDVVFSLQRAILLNMAPSSILTQFGFTKRNIMKRIRATDTFEVTIETSKAFSPNFLLNCLATPVASIIDKKEVLAHDRDGDLGHQWLQTHSAGSGPFRFSRWKANEYLILKRNKHYWAEMPALHKVVIRHINSSDEQKTLLLNGQVDVARNLDLQQLQELNNPDILTHISPKAWLVYLALNQKNPYLKNPKVRLALKYLIDYEGIEKNILKGQVQIHQSFIPKGFLGSLDEKPFSLQVEKAKKLLAEAGFENGFTITMDAKNIALAYAIRDSFAKANITLEVIPGNNSQTLCKFRNRDHDIFLGVWGADYHDPHSFAEAFAKNPDNSDNANEKTLAWRNTWQDIQMNQKVDEALFAKPIPIRALHYVALQREHQLVSPFVVLFQKNEVTVTRKNVHNFKFGPCADTTLYHYAFKS